MMDDYWTAFHNASDPNRPLRESQDRSSLAQLQQLQGVQGLLEHSADRQRQQAARAAIAALPPGATGEQVMTTLRPFMEPKDVATMAHQTMDLNSRLDSTKQVALARLTHAASTAQSLHQYRMSMLTKQEDRNAEIARHNGEIEQLQREGQALTGQRINLGVANAAFNQRNAAANTAFNTGASVAPTVNAPPQGAPAAPATASAPLSELTQPAQAAPLAAPSRPSPTGPQLSQWAPPNSVLPTNDKGEITGIPPGEEAAARAAGLRVNTWPQTGPPPIADAANLDARDLRARAQSAFDARNAAAPVPRETLAPVAGPVAPTAPAKPNFVTANDAPKGMVGRDASQWAHDVNRSLLAQENVTKKGELKLNQAGGRESVFINRVVNSGNQAAADLENVVKLPMSASRGFFGGRGQDHGLFNAGKETLANAMTTQEVQSYNVFATGFQRALAAIEGAGLAPTNALMNQMDQVIFKEGDTNFTKMMKLAQIRQIVDKGLETITANSRVDAETKKLVDTIRAKVNKSVPFTGSDLIDLQTQQALDPKITLGDVIGKMKNKGAPAISAEDQALIDKYKPK